MIPAAPGIPRPFPARPAPARRPPGPPAPPRPKANGPDRPRLPAGRRAVRGPPAGVGWKPRPFGVSYRSVGWAVSRRREPGSGRGGACLATLELRIPRRFGVVVRMIVGLVLTVVALAIAGRRLWWL